MLRRFNYKDCSPVATPFNPTYKLTQNSGRPIAQLEYAKVIGYLMYAMTSTRPDIAFAVGKLSRYISNLSKFHWHVICQVLKCLNKTQDYGLSYLSYPSVIEGCSDASWITNKEDYASMSGWVYLLGGGAVSWASKKQTCITDSTMAAEFVALATASKEAKWLRNLLLEGPLRPKPMSLLSIHCDSKSTLSRVYSYVYNEKSRHIGHRHAYVH